jgi:hypothetical protein
MPPELKLNTDSLIYYGGELKALDETGRIGGPLILWGSPDLPDATEHKDFFVPETDFWVSDWPTKAVVLYHHGLDGTLGSRKLTLAELKMTDASVWLDAQLALRDDYERKIFEAIKRGKMGLSSGSVSHLVRREKQANGTHKIVSWPIFEASITPTPGEPRTTVMALKSLIEGTEVEGASEAPPPVNESSPAGSAPAPTFVDDCLGLAASLKQRAAEFQKLGPTKREALKALRDSLDGLYHASRPVELDALAARRKALEERYASVVG